VFRWGQLVGKLRKAHAATRIIRARNPTESGRPPVIKPAMIATLKVTAGPSLRSAVVDEFQPAA
jgi:hypothetical protein